MDLYQRRAVKTRHLGQFVIDALAWSAAICFAVLLRYGFDWSRTDWKWVMAYVAGAIMLQGFGGWWMALYRGRYPYGSFDEAKPLLVVVAGVAGVLFVVDFILFPVADMPRSAPLIALPIAFVLMGSVRYVRRVLVERRYRPGQDAQRTLVYGAGYLGESLVRRLLRDPASAFLPVGLLDDDPQKQHLRLMGTAMLGRGSDMSAAAHKTGATAVIFCVARADAETLRRVSDQADAAGLRLMVLPLLSEILQGQATADDVRDIKMEDLIGRRPVDTDVAAIAGYVTGKRVLVTGAGGSIGSELCRQLVQFSPAELIMLDRDETGLQGTQISISGRGLLDTNDVVLADIRDADALSAIFESRRPEVVFHTAALKHLPMLEQYPEEGWKTNVLGTLNVLEAARTVGVETFVNISTDKAANPTSVLGRTKRLAEQLTAWASSMSDGKYLSVRFGNVIGSRGSMLPLFTTQIANGGPVTVTHPDVTRYFMTIPEACQLVVQAGGIGRDGEVLILDMGESVRILDIAQRMIAMSGQHIDIEFTGLRPGEKMSEDLVAHGETEERPFHPKISHAGVAPLRPDNLPAQTQGPLARQDLHEVAK